MGSKVRKALVVVVELALGLLIAIAAGAINTVVQFIIIGLYVVFGVGYLVSQYSKKGSNDSPRASNEKKEVDDWDG